MQSLDRVNSGRRIVYQVSTASLGGISITELKLHPTEVELDGPMAFKNDSKGRYFNQRLDSEISLQNSG